jgi:hypothetical protein
MEIFGKNSLQKYKNVQKGLVYVCATKIKATKTTLFTFMFMLQKSK